MGHPAHVYAMNLLHFGCRGGRRVSRRWWRQMAGGTGDTAVGVSNDVDHGPRMPCACAQWLIVSLDGNTVADKDDNVEIADFTSEAEGEKQEGFVSDSRELLAGRRFEVMIGGWSCWRWWWCQSLGAG